MIEQSPKGIPLACDTAFRQSNHARPDERLYNKPRDIRTLEREIDRTMRQRAIKRNFRTPHWEW